MAEDTLPAASGDVNQDGCFDAEDVRQLQQWLAAVPGAVTGDWTAADFRQDGRLDVFDLCLMRQALLAAQNAAPDKKQIAVVNLMQKPELPTGCEVVSLTILLNHLGYPAEKLTMARTYLPKLDFYWSGGVYYGADFLTTFAGNPESSHAYGCYAPCIVTTADNYFRDNGYDARAENLTGTEFDTLLTDYIARDIPVLIWITSNNLAETKLTSVWTTPDGERVQWTANEHCVVLTGYDREEQLVYVSDPLSGNISYDYTKCRQRYIDMGQQAVWIRQGT